MWALTRIDHELAREVVNEALADPSPSVRLTAARSASVWRGGNEFNTKSTTIAYLLDLIRTGDQPQIIREAATALGRIGTAGDPVRTLLEAVEKNGGRDLYLDHSLIYALIEINHWNLHELPLSSMPTQTFGEPP